MNNYQPIKLHVNEKALARKRKLRLVKIKITATIVAGIIVLTGLLAIAKKLAKEIKIDETRNTISNFYGDGSEERKIFEYICISNELNDLDLDKYNYNEELYAANISNDQEPKPPYEIRNLIEEYKKNRNFEKDLHTANDHAKVIFELIHQSELVNSHIYTDGYKVSNEDVTRATKEYTAEVYDIDADDIVLRRTNPSSSAPSEYRIKVDVSGKYGNKEVTETINDYGDTKTITRGIDHMINTQNNETDDKDKEDNNQHNEDRNKYITNAMLYAIELDQARESENLYNSDLAEDLSEEIEEVSKHIR